VGSARANQNLRLACNRGNKVQVFLNTSSGSVTGVVTRAGDFTFSTVAPSAGALGTLTDSLIDIDHTTGLGGQVTWNYSVANSAIAYLAVGQSKVETFSFNLLDDHGGSVAATVSVTIVGVGAATV
jgi:VCBS repeat-containing protein